MAGASAALLALVGSGTADAAIALGVVVSTNPANYTPHINQGAVYKMAEVGGILYAGGEFTSVTAAPGVGGGTVNRSNIVAFNAATGVIQPFAPGISGQVWAIVASGGSLYVGGTFTAVDGVARRGLVKLNPTTGAVDTAFNAGLTSGVVREAAVVNGRLIISGTFPGKVRAVSLTTGANTGYINVAISGSVASNAGPTEVYRFAVDPLGTRLVGIGNFTSVGGQTRYRAFMLTLGATSASLNAWDYLPLRNLCASSTTTDYLRDVDFSPDGTWFVIVSTGFVPRSGQIGTALCDATARFETSVPSPAVPTWINYTGGDTLHSVAATDVAVYVQGHQRWLDNPLGRDTAGPGAVSRPGIGAINPVTGKALLTWNPTKDRGVGGKDLLVTARGLWVGSDTTRIGGELHPRVALLPVP
ncbi:MAG TPA: delta-60 repeat domain-containing protein [Actinoplanes sp.]|nr:delta-60 repeat domain-containing protein [Actinoplanes sp.]